MNVTPSRQFGLGVKLVLLVLVIITVSAALAAVTGANILGVWNVRNNHAILNRVVAGTLAMYCGFAVYACGQRRIMGWWSVTVLWVLTLVAILTGAAWNAFHMALPLLGLILGAVGEFVKVAISAAIFLRVWWPLRKEFTSGAGQVK